MTIRKNTEIRSDVSKEITLNELIESVKEKSRNILELESNKSDIKEAYVQMRMSLKQKAGFKGKSTSLKKLNEEATALYKENPAGLMNQLIKGHLEMNPDIYGGKTRIKTYSLLDKNLSKPKRFFSMFEAKNVVSSDIQRTLNSKSIVNESDKSIVFETDKHTYVVKRKKTLEMN